MEFKTLKKITDFYKKYEEDKKILNQLNSFVREIVIDKKEEREYSYALQNLIQYVSDEKRVEVIGILIEYKEESITRKELFLKEIENLLYTYNGVDKS